MRGWWEGSECVDRLVKALLPRQQRCARPASNPPLVAKVAASLAPSYVATDRGDIEVLKEG